MFRQFICTLPKPKENVLVDIVDRIPVEIAMKLFKYIYSYRDIASFGLTSWSCCKLVSLVYGLKLDLPPSVSGGTITDINLKEVVNCGALQAMNLSGCLRVTDLGFSVIGFFCPQLESLDLSGSIALSNNSLLAIAKGCQSLLYLNISRCEFVGNSGLEALGMYCKDLRVLNISSCWSVTDWGCIAIAKNCTKITDIDLTFCDRVTDEGIVAFLHYCKLTALRIRSCHITSKTLQNIIAFNQTGLRILDLRRCYELLKVDLEAVQAYCKELVEFYVDIHQLK